MSTNFRKSNFCTDLTKRSCPYSLTDARLQLNFGLAKLKWKDVNHAAYDIMEGIQKIGFTSASKARRLFDATAARD